MTPWAALDALGGVAEKWELMRERCDADVIDMAVTYGRILRVRRGWYASRDTPPAVLRALRVGGRLACVSAIAFYEGGPEPDELHVLVRAGASRLAAGPGVVVHWTRRKLAGTRGVVSETVARQQASRCRALLDPRRALFDG